MFVHILIQLVFEFVFSVEMKIKKIKKEVFSCHCFDIESFLPRKVHEKFDLVRHESQVEYRRMV